jgi:hypothetical protein
MANLTVLRPAEEVELDPLRLSELYREFGIPDAERMVSRAVTEIAVQMAALVRHYNEAEFQDFAHGLRRLRRLADHAGFYSLAQASDAVAECLAAAPRSTGDATALAATWARLMRLAARAMSTGGDLRGLSG